MKKLVLILAVAFGASMVACSNSEKAAESNVEENAPVEVEEVAAEVVDTLNAGTDSAVVDTTVVEAAAAAVAE